MTLQQDMDSKLKWTQGEIDALKSKYKRTHFNQFNGLDLKPQRFKIIFGKRYVWSLGRWKLDNG